MVPKAVLMRSGLVSLTTARPVNTAQPKTIVNSTRPMTNFFNKAHSTVRRPINNKIATKNNNFYPRVNTISGKNVNTARPKALVNTARPKAVVNTTRPKAVLNAVKGNQANLQMDLQDQGVIDSVCSSHMTRNCPIILILKKLIEDMLPLEVTPKEGKSQAKVPRKNNMYSVDLKNIVSKGGLTFLFAKATSDESKLWHRRLGHINFKTMNKLVKGNLVRGLPSKLFENDQTCVGCQKGKKHRASYDYSRFSWVFFLATKDETSGILKSFITRVENLIDQKVKWNNWLFDIDALSKSMNYSPVIAGIRSYGKCTYKRCDDACSPDVGFKPSGDNEKKIFVYSYDAKDVGVEVDMNNLNTLMPISPIPTTRIHKDQPVKKIIGDLNLASQTRRMTKNLKEHEEPKKVIHALKDPSWIEAMQDELLQFKLQKVWTLVDLPNGKRPIGTKWVYRNKKDERGIVIMNKARLIKEEVYVGLSTPGFEDLNFPDKVSERKNSRLCFAGKDISSKTSTPMETQKPLLKDEDGEEVDVHLYRSMIGSLMYLTSSRPDIMFVVCACARYQVNPKVSHLHVVKRIFRYLKGQPKLGLWYPKDSPFDLVAYTDSDYAGASLDRKSTTGGCQFLGCRLISWQCKKQIVVANSTTEAEYVAASIKNPIFHSKTKHIEIRHHFIRDSNEKKLIQMIKIHTDKNVADLLTKAFDVKTVNGEQQLQALVDGKKIVVAKAFVRRDLQLDDEEELHQLDTFYNALNANDQDSLNSAAGGIFLDKMPRECLKIIESKSKVRNSRNKAVVAKVSSNSSTPEISPDVAALTTEVSELKNMMKTMLIDKQKAQAPVPVKAVEQSCVTCGGAHSYRKLSAPMAMLIETTFKKYVSQAAAANFNQGNTNFLDLRWFAIIHSCQPPVYQAQPYQASAPQMQGVSKTDFENYVKANDAILRNMQNQGQGLQNQMTNLTEMLSKFVNSNTASSSSSGSLPSNTVTNPKEDLKGITTRSGVAYQGPTIPTSSPKVVERRTEVTKDTIFPTNNGITKDVQPPVVPVENQNPVSEPVDAYVSALMP
ncbi:putative ribonuclease H-like domain-containing protein [Tanacetum coccineum]